MTVKYNIFSLPISNEKVKNKKLLIKAVSKEVFTTEELAEAIGYSSSLTESDVMGVLNALSYHMVHQLQQGKRIHIKGLGYFYISATGIVESGKKIRGDMVKFRTVRFRPEKELKNRLKNVRFKRAAIPSLSASHSSNEIETILKDYFKDHTYITRAEFQTLSGISKTKALDYLKILLEQGKLKKGGVYNSPVYEPTESFFKKGQA